MIRVVGVGGAGVNAVNRMVEARIPGVEFMAVNTDLQSLQLCVADVTVHIGDEQTRGLGAGADPEVGHRSAFEEQDKIKRLLKGSDMVFVAAGAGGGTGTGAAPVVARLAREVGALTVGIVTKPFSFEGSRRGNQASKGIEELAAEVDTLIVVPNDRLLEVLDQQTSMVEAFQVADDVLRQGVQGISDLVTLPALINLDFADVRTIMSEAGRALLGIGMGTGEGRALLAAEKAISSPLLETSMEGARVDPALDHRRRRPLAGGGQRGGEAGRRGGPPRRQHHLRRQRRRGARRPGLGDRRRDPLRRPRRAAAPRRRADDPAHQGQRPRRAPAPRRPGELAASTSPSSSPASSDCPMNGVVAAGHPLTAEAGAEVLREGGNAVDAAVGAVLASFAVESPLTGFGAGGFMMVHREVRRRRSLLDFFVAAPGARRDRARGRAGPGPGPLRRRDRADVLRRPGLLRGARDRRRPGAALRALRLGAARPSWSGRACGSPARARR